jgi:DNA ligase-1
MVLLKKLAEVSARVSSTTRKKEKTSLLAHLLREAKGKEVLLVASYLSGQLPQGRLGVGWASFQGALEGVVRNPRPLNLIEVDRFFESIAAEKGPGSLERRARLLRELFSGTEELETDFLMRLILGEIRQGASEGLVLEGIAQASSLSIDRLRHALMFSGDIGEVARAALEEGTQGLSLLKPKLFHPISPMLANPVEGEAEALGRLGEAGWEYKIDGARVQIHKEGDEIRIFSRHLNEVTASVPEIVALSRKLPFEKAVFEGEVIALRHDGRPYPFQITMRRFGRIKDVERMEKEFPLTPYFFDLLYADGEPLLDRPYRERFGLLTERTPSAWMIPQIVTGDEKTVQEFLRKSLDAGHEGLMAKGIDSPYVAGQRGFHWLKLKVAETLDLVVLAAEWGHGRRKGWLSNLHLGARDPDSGRFVMLGKTFKGLTDEMLRWQTERLLKIESGRDQWTVYVKPELVVEIAYNDLQESPRYPGGLALRFARVRRYREDKTPAEADTLQKIWQLYDSKWKMGTGGLMNSHA